ncbi:hypothetical protein [Acinetobacter ursingii]|uniref:hypothetical protein n=1 Tax=Acinetobacter ursingii TaxID=108980 RepID=UPI00039F7A63|nr:hypothetical protein [Acinetobacter ursingii]
MNDAPTATANSVTTDEDTAVTGNVIGQDGRFQKIWCNPLISLETRNLTPSQK